MWSHMLPMTVVVVLSHIMSICPSTAAPQNLIIPSGSGGGGGIMEVGIPSSRYEDMSSSSSSGSSGSESWEDGSSSQKDKNDLLQSAFLLAASGGREGQGQKGQTVGEMVILGMMANPDEGIPSKSTSPSRTGSGLVKVFKRSGIRHRYEFDPWTVPTGGNGNEILTDHHEQSGSVSGPEEGMTLMYPTYIRNRLMKRSPRCLRRCLAQGLLHPSQCHSLC